MSSMSPVPLRLSPLGRQSMAQLVSRARNLGVAPEDYARQLVEDGLALQREAEAMTIGQIMGPVRQAAGTVDEAEIVALVKKARANHRREAGRRKKR